MLRRAAGFLSACALLSSSALAADKPTIASTSLCGDSYVLALAPERINALSWQSRDPISQASKAQKTLPQIWDNPEVLINSGADIILFGPGEGRYAGQLPQQTITLDWGEDFETVFKNVEKIRTVIPRGHSVAVKLWEANLNALKERATGRTARRFGDMPTVLYLSRSAGTAGPETYVDTAITTAGGQNLITQAGWHTPDPEYLISLDPDIVVTSFFEDGYESVQAAGLRHNVLSELINSKPRVDIPGALWPCAGPGMIEATKLIADGLDALP